MNILITGGVGSGTTFMARMFEELGFDLGHHTHVENPRNAENDQVRGVEHAPLSALTREWTWRLDPATEPFVLRLDDPEFAATQEEAVREVSESLPDVVKQPLMTRYLGLWILAGGKEPEHVIVCMRDTYDQARSNARDGFSSGNVFDNRRAQLMDYGTLWETLHRADINYDVVQFPRCVASFDYLYEAVAWETLGVEDGRLTQAWKKIADPSKIQTKDREAARRVDLQNHEVRQPLDIEKLGGAFDVFVGMDRETKQGVRDFVVIKGA